MQIFLHVGQPKSGTSAIQRAFARHSDQDPAPIVYYPKAGRLKHKTAAGHHNLAYELYDPSKFSGEQGSWADMAAEVRAAGVDAVLISSEAFRANLAAPVAGKIGELFPEAGVVVVLYLRPQWEYVESGYNQLLRFGRTDQTVREFWAGTGRLICDYEGIVDAWRDAFGEAALRCLPYDAAVREQGVVRHFVRHALGSDSDFDDPARVNNRTGPTMISGVRYCRDRLREAWEDPGAHLSSAVVAKVSHHFRDHDRDGPAHTFMSPAMRDEIYETVIETNRRLAARFPAFDAPAFLERPAQSAAAVVTSLPDLTAEDKRALDRIIRESLKARARVPRR